MMFSTTLALCLFLLLDPAMSFVPSQPRHASSSSSPSSSSSYQDYAIAKKSSNNHNNKLFHFMGGYYNEPTDTEDQSDTHMIFGVRCVEDTIYCSLKTSIQNLRPVDGRETDTKPIAQQRLVQYLLTPDDGSDDYAKPDLKEKRIVQIGTGGTALALSKYGGVSHVVVIDNDATRLKIYEHAYQQNLEKKDDESNNTTTSDSDNDDSEPSSSTNATAAVVAVAPLETMFLEPKDALPKADIIILSTQDEEWIGTALDSDRTKTVLFEGAY